MWLCFLSQIRNVDIKENSFWAKIKEDRFERDEIFEALSKTFAAKAAKTEDGSKKKAKSFKVLNPKKAQNLSIILGSLKTSFENIKKMILNCDENLEASTIESILNDIPTASE
ncbi:diaphanous homolog 2-like, partial [Paramuricea clavata]